MLTAQGYVADVVEAVLAARFDEPIDALARVKALTELKGRDDFDALAGAFKRVVNIIKGGTTQTVDPKLFEAACEDQLHQQLITLADRLKQQIEMRNYATALTAIAALRPAVDAFFDGVMVMAENPQVRNNRLALLTGVARLFTDIADFSRISA
jgi:glycyl-tRNA synthetase beta chain